MKLIDTCDTTSHAPRPGGYRFKGVQRGRLSSASAVVRTCEYMLSEPLELAGKVRGLPTTLACYLQDKLKEEEAEQEKERSTSSSTSSETKLFVFTSHNFRKVNAEEKNNSTLAESWDRRMKTLCECIPLWENHKKGKLSAKLGKSTGEVGHKRCQAKHHTLSKKLYLWRASL